MTHEMPEHLPPVPDGYVYAGRLGDYPSDKTLRGICTETLCHQGEWSAEVPWNGTDGSYFLTGAWHYAAPIDSDLGRKILAERSLDTDFGDPPPDLIILKDAAEEIGFPTIVADLADAGYRLEIDSDGIRGWKDD